MTISISEIEQSYLEISASLQSIAKQLEANLVEAFAEFPHIDKISSRVKQRDSFLEKASKLNEDGSPRYPNPFREIQDILGARIVVFYKSDVEEVKSKVHGLFQFVEHRDIVEDDVKKFGYEGTHFICHIPSFIHRDKSNHNVPYFFELQIKTLYQHAWAQSQHGLGYKPNTPLPWEKERKIAFLAAQSWGADEILMQLVLDQ